MFKMNRKDNQMSRKEIDAEKLTACKTSMQEMNKRFEGEITGLIQSSATESMQGAEDALNKMSANLVTTVDSLDVYLNQVAHYFLQMDNDLAKGIGTETSMFTYSNPQARLTPTQKKQYNVSKQMKEDYKLP